MATEDKKDSIPAWNGQEDTWNNYLVDVEWYFWATPVKDRHLIASKLARKLTGSAKNAIQGLRPKEFAGRQGITRLLRILQARIGDLPIPDLASKLDEYFFKLKRKLGDTMNERGRSQEAYRHLLTALDRVKGKPQDLGDFEPDADQPWWLKDEWLDEPSRRDGDDLSLIHI